jgi:hypothetical protein
MIRPLCPDRVRKINGSFAFIEHRFLQDGFWSDLDQHGLLLYLLLVLVADRHGLSYYSYDKICTLLRLTLDDYILARNSLIDKDLIAFDGRLFQVLSLPSEPKRTKGELLLRREQLEREDPATVRQLIEKSFKRHSAI